MKIVLWAVRLCMAVLVSHNKSVAFRWKRIKEPMSSPRKKTQELTLHVSLDSEMTFSQRSHF
jgi:hypothetical protein